MAEYIEREALENAFEDENKNGNFVFTANWIMEILDNLPPADVVPKSEVESIITLNSQLEAQVFEQRKEIERLKKYNTDVAFKHYNDGKTELASEIFAEIDKNFILISIYDIGFEELKKKYTEEHK